jgi:acyl-CoA reductase-like NAD-dependent aldehyde dehydrogenase
LIGSSYGKTGTVISDPGLAIKGFQGSSQTGHALNQVINRGVRPEVLLETTRNPLVVLQQAGNLYLYLTDDAAVVLTGNGQVVTAWTRSEFLPHVKQIIRDAGGAQ